MGKPKMWNILQTADRRAKGTNIWDAGTTVHVWRLFLMPDYLSLVWGYLVHFAKFPILQFVKLCFSPNFHPISSKVYTSCPNHGAIQATCITFFGDLPKLKKKYGILKFVITVTGP